MRRRQPGSATEFNMSFKTANDPTEVLRNRRAFLSALGIPLECAVFMKQSHGDHVAVITQSDLGKGAASPESAIPDSDAMITRDRGVFLAALGADCALVALCDRKAGVAGMVHAGWRGTGLGIVQKAVRRMSEEFGCEPARVLAGIGPAIGPCCYEVGPEVVEAAKDKCGPEAVVRRGGKSYLDLRRATVHQLLAEGVRPENVEVADVCTSCAHDRFFSYRRDGPTGGRFCGIAGWMR